MGSFGFLSIDVASYVSKCNYFRRLRFERKWRMGLFSVLFIAVASYVGYKTVSWLTSSNKNSSSSSNDNSNRWPQAFRPIHKLGQYFSYKASSASEVTVYQMTAVWRAVLPHEDLDPKTYADFTQYNVKLSHSLGVGVYTMASSTFRFDDNINLGDHVILLPSGVYGRKLFTDEIINLMKREENNCVGSIKEILKFKLTFECKNCKFNLYTDTYTVIFRPGRYTVRYQYRALDQIDGMSLDLRQHFLFPEVSHAPYCSSSAAFQLKYINTQVDSNAEQRAAVQHIAFTKHYQAPYIVFGPPGTGKTTTIVEGILQLYRHQPESRILIMAATNSVCDEIAVRLLKANPCMSVYRVFSQSTHQREHTTDALLMTKERSNYAIRYCPEISYIHRYRIVVCTLSIGGKLALGDHGKGIGKEYTHIFVDEAAACTEPDILMGVASLLSRDVNLILSGDHKQLGPVLVSKAAKSTLLRVSLLERLLNLPCYQKDAQGRYNRNIHIRLRNNYRSHPAIVKLFNELYYNNELRAMAKPEPIQLSKKLREVMNSKFPITLHASYDESTTSEDTKSSSNHAELDIVMEYVDELTTNMGISQSDIGIISPYKDQLRLMKKRLVKRACENIETGTVETFQGKEKRCVIISFVRSKTNLGFLNSRERLNVMISRPKSLLIMVGNPKTLRQSKDFQYIIDACSKNHKNLGPPKAPSKVFNVEKKKPKY